MTVQVGEFIRAFINGTERTEYVVSYSRKDSLCELGSSFTLELDPDLPSIPDPYDDIEIKEYFDGDLGTVLKGYSVDISREFDPGTFIITGQDKSVLLHEYFINEQLVSGGESVDYWINRVASMAGFDVQFEVTSPAFVPEGTPLGLQTAGEVILMLERTAAYYVKYSSAIDKLLVFRLGTSEPIMTIETEDTLSAHQEIKTEKTRNVVKIYGGYKFDFLTNTSNQIFVKSRANIPELITDKTVVIANPAIRSYTSAYIVANRILDVVSTVDDEQAYLLEGFFPSVEVGRGVYVNVDFLQYDVRGNQLITSIEAIVDRNNGVTTQIGTGDKCPRLSVQLPIPPILVATDLDGVGISWNGGDSFVPSNVGLTTDDDKNAWSIAANQYSQQMVLTSGGLFRRFGSVGAWHVPPTPMPDPVNSAGDSPPFTVTNLSLDKVVDEPTRMGTFHVLTTTSGFFTPLRSWIYTTEDFGNSWDSTQLYIDKIPSGRAWNVQGIDIETSMINNMYCLVTGTFYGSGAYLGKQTGFFGTKTFDIYTWDQNNAPSVKHTMSLVTANTAHLSIFSITGAKRYAVAVISERQTSTTIKPKFAVAITTDNGDTWEDVYNGQVTAAYPTLLGESKTPRHVMTSAESPMVFDYYSTPTNIYLHWPLSGIGITYLGDDGDCYEYRQYSYDGGGFSINIVDGAVSISTVEHSNLFTNDFKVNHGGAGDFLYTPISSRYLTGNKNGWQLQTRWVFSIPTVDKCPDFTYQEDDQIVIADIYTENPTTAVTRTAPAGYTLYSPGTLGRNEAYDEGYYYSMLVSGAYMFYANGFNSMGNVELNNILLGPEITITNFNEIETMEDL
jgi:hypothetical protein